MFRLTKEKDRTYLLNFDDSYTLAMIFLRYQEYYESDNPRFYRKNFTIASYIDWYVKHISDKKIFDYHKRWAGFNLPTWFIDNVISKGIPDPNHYDALMNGIVQTIKSDANNDDCYIIGISGKKKSKTYIHEMAHALYYLNKNYQNTVKEIYCCLPDDYKNTIKNNIINIGYAESSVIDEAQAFSIEDKFDIIWHDKEKDDVIDGFIKNIKETYDCCNK
jgi:hypothetical protein